MIDNGILQSVDPATTTVVWEGVSATKSAVSEAVGRARAALRDWACSAIENRISILRRYAQLLSEQSDTIATVISRETGKPLWESKAELATMIGKVEFSITARDERAGERNEVKPFGHAVLRHRPHGVMAVLGPFNFPGHLANGHIVPALLAGNTIVFKPSEETPWTGELLVRTLHDAGVPDDVVNLVQGGREVGQALTDADIDGVLFTGSAATGSALRRALLERPHVLLALELGGNNPLVVWEGADDVAGIVAQSAFLTTGQRCSCARRLIVPEGAAGDRILAACIDFANRLRVGAWNDIEAPFMGPLVSASSASRVRAQYDALLAAGANALLPAQWGGRSAAFVTPALLDVTGMDAPDVEIFGPILQVTRVPDFDAAIAAANATTFGLSAGLISRDQALWDRFNIDARAGVVNWNRPTNGAAASMPFGGLGASGNHRPSAYYAADYCAYPVASFEAPLIEDMRAEFADRIVSPPAIPC